MRSTELGEAGEWGLPISTDTDQPGTRLHLQQLLPKSGTSPWSLELDVKCITTYCGWLSPQLLGTACSP